MKLLKLHLVFALLASMLAIAAPPALAQGISQKVATCDPAFPTRCLKPAADGSITVTVAGSSSGAVPSTNLSGTVTTGNTYQTIQAASTARKGCTIVNTSANVMTVRVSGAVYPLLANQSFGCSVQGAPGSISDLIEITSPVATSTFSATFQ